MTNPSGTAYLKSFSTAISYTIPYTINELSSKNICTTLPTQLGNFSAFYNKFGSLKYNEQTIAIGYAKAFNSHLSIGFNFNYIHYQLSNKINKGTPYSSLGFQIIPIKNIKIGALVINPENTQITINEEDATLPSLYTIGLQWISSKYFTVSYELEKELHYTSISKIGLAYAHKNFLWFRTGILGKPMAYTLGLGLRIQSFTVDLAFATHNELGNTSSIGLTFQPQTKK